MELRLLPILNFLLLIVAVRPAPLPSEFYWNAILEGAPIPKVVQELLRSDGAKKDSPAGENMMEHAGHMMDGETSPFDYKYGASEAQLKTDRSVPLFFLEKDLYMGKKMNLQFFRTTTNAPLLPRCVAESIPFSSEKLPDVMNQFGVDPGSPKARAMKKTIEICEGPAQDREEKACATSLESMVDFSVSKLGKRVRAMSTEVDKEHTPKQEYMIAGEVEKAGENSVVCHSQTYVYSVFYCHITRATKTYKVPLIGADGTKVTAVAVCHTDTTKWNPMYIAFQILKIEPGTIPICHFLPEDHMVWAAK